MLDTLGHCAPASAASNGKQRSRRPLYPERPLGDLIIELRNGVSPKPWPEPPGIPILRISSVRPFSVSESDVRYLRAKDDVDSYQLARGDLLFTRYSGSLEYVGVCGMVRAIANQGLVYPDKLMRVRVDTSRVLPGWIEIVANGPASRKYIESVARTSAGQTGISGSDLKALSIPVPTIAQQAEIVRQVDELLALTGSITRRYAAAVTQLERLTPTILSSVINGELLADALQG